MCGFAGFLGPSDSFLANAEAILTKMRDCLVHRGPNNAGNWLDPEAGIALSHRRLSIVDLSPAGHQPMLSRSGRYVLVFNGEIFNHLEIRKQLEVKEQILWRGHSDTESLLTAIEYWGLERTLKASVGMFALALWDRQNRELSIARDRMGEKPLYYGWQRGIFLFGSELKALRAHHAFESVIEEGILSTYLRHGYIPAPWSVWRNIHKLMPGTWVSIRASDQDKVLHPKSYWSYYEAALHGQANPFCGSDEEVIDTLETTLKSAVRGQMVADVSIGAFLSGGIDSSTVVALMQAQSRQKINTFSIGFNESQYDEAAHAKAVANFLGTDHIELYVSPNNAQNVIPQLPEIFDEPFGDSSAIPSIILSKLARQHVIVSLSGDGGDELFGGYHRYFNTKAKTIWSAGQIFPASARDFVSQALRSTALININDILHQSAEMLGSQIGKSLVAKFALAADLIQSPNPAACYQVMTSQWTNPPTIKQDPLLRYGLTDQQQRKLKKPIERMMAQDTVTYLPDDILVKVDRSAMAFGLETRVPLLDHRVIELALQIPCNIKIRNARGKWPLRALLARYIPSNFIDRPKMGFGIPIAQWLRGPLRDWGEELLSRKRLEHEGFFIPDAVRDRWNEHQLGRHNWGDSLWIVLMWQAWLESNTSK